MDKFIGQLRDTNKPVNGGGSVTGLVRVCTFFSFSSILGCPGLDAH